MQKLNLGEYMLFGKLKQLKFHCFTEAGAVLGWALLLQIWNKISDYIIVCVFNEREKKDCPKNHTGDTTYRLPNRLFSDLFSTWECQLT